MAPGSEVSFSPPMKLLGSLDKFMNCSILMSTLSLDFYPETQLHQVNDVSLTHPASMVNFNLDVLYKSRMTFQSINKANYFELFGWVSA